MTQNQAGLICEALVREIAQADRWSAIEEAWSALLHVRHMAQSIQDEREQFIAAYSGSSQQQTGATGSNRY